VNFIQASLLGLENILQSLARHFKGFGTGFTQLRAKLEADTSVVKRIITYQLQAAIALGITIHSMGSLQKIHRVKIITNQSK
jgi:hypothetical protein